MEQLYIDLDKEEIDNAYGQRSSSSYEIHTETAGGQDNVLIALRSILLLYMRSNHADLYSDYYRGFKHLVAWLQPIALPLKEIPYAKLPLQLSNWEVSELAKILNCNEELVFYTLLSIHNSGECRKA